MSSIKRERYNMHSIEYAALGTYNGSTCRMEKLVDNAERKYSGGNNASISDYGWNVANEVPPLPYIRTYILSFVLI